MKSWRSLIVFALISVAGFAVYFFVFSSNSPQSYEGTELSGKASDFQLTDQNRSTVNLSEFRGRVVVLTFMDTKCTDTCPLIAVHFREVYRQLTVEENNVSDVLETTHSWRLDEILSWHFLTGSQEVLAPVWKEYGVSATHSHDSDAIMHTPGTFLID